MAAESQYILAVYIQPEGTPGSVLSTPLVLHTAVSETSGFPYFPAEVCPEPRCLRPGPGPFLCCSVNLLQRWTHLTVLPASALSCLCTWDTIFLFLYSLPVSDHLWLQFLFLCSPLNSELSLSILSRGVCCPCKAPQLFIHSLFSKLQPFLFDCPLLLLDSIQNRLLLLLVEAAVPHGPSLSWRASRWLGFCLWNCKNEGRAEGHWVDCLWEGRKSMSSLTSSYMFCGAVSIISVCCLDIQGLNVLAFQVLEWIISVNPRI